MGFTGYGLYDGDCTLTCIYDFAEWSGMELPEDLDLKNMKVSKENKLKFIKNMKKVLSKMPKIKCEPEALEWQMLGCFFLDNGIKIPLKIKKQISAANDYLLILAYQWKNPAARRRHLLKFSERLK